jgi:iron(III) transport system substrate-binding protein
LVLALFLAGHQTGSQPAAAKTAEGGGVVTLYTSVPQELIDQYKQEFEKKHPQIRVNVYRAGTNEVLAKLKAEQQAGGVAADVIWVADTASAELLKGQKLLQKYNPPEAAKISAAMKDKDGYYYGSRVINMVLGYNTKNTSAPKSWRDFLDPRHKGKIGLPNVTSGSSYTFVGALAAHPSFGWKFFEEMRANGGIQVKANMDAVQKLATGELSLVAILDYMVKEMKDQGSPVDYVIPAEGAVMVISPIALVAGGKNLAGGEKFIDYTLSKEGQAMMSRQNVVSVRTDITPPPGVPAVADIKAFPLNNAYLNDARAEIHQKFNAIFAR